MMPDGRVRGGTGHLEIKQASCPGPGLDFERQKRAFPKNEIKAALLRGM
jgi:hypothetical protein